MDEPHKERRQHKDSELSSNELTTGQDTRMRRKGFVVSVTGGLEWFGKNQIANHMSGDSAAYVYKKRKLAEQQDDRQEDPTVREVDDLD